MSYKAVNRKGVMHEDYCLNDAPGVTVCICDPIRSAPEEKDGNQDDYGDPEVRDPQPGRSWEIGLLSVRWVTKRRGSRVMTGHERKTR